MTDSPRVAYFCMEYGLDERLRTYSGGLGILAGDTLKAAHDLGVPMVALGIRWAQGYTTQTISDDGRQVDVYRDYPADDLLDDTGVEVTVQIRGDDVRCKVWKADGFGNVPLYLLDTDLDGNPHRDTTARLYGGGPDARVAQEIVLGVGGVRALRALDLDVDLYHFNEGHALLAAFELVREKMEGGAEYDDALAATEQEVVFTTHTPVLAGNETHPVERLRTIGAAGPLSDAQLEALGGDPFSMTVAALRLASRANAVAALHAQTANQMWDFVDGRPPILPITNGVHRPTWVDPAMLDAAERGGDLWTPHLENKRALADFVEERTGQRLDPDNLIIGFARRAATYKRAPLVFEDEDRIAPLLESGRLQLVFSGKAHPSDEGGKAIVARLVAMARKYPRGVVFLEDYGMPIGRAMTRGTDVWLNNPRRPKEASGTSGMKAAMNGVLNLSVLDGWWPEAAEDGVNGWQIGGGFESPDEAAQDAHDLADLYRVLLDEVVPTYYDDRERWTEMMRASIQSTRDRFSAERMVTDYVEQLYAPTAGATA
ncbi:alpha-glucan family phosphorylase [Rubrivirga sp. S365]|uniref:glycogen phosphorylase n=1 Tax=Rubrivirga litoralis TaxID=3075598 RepID=A0ABU3BV08_9BACT|nr:MULTISPECIES: alpha-glucan family phosphorylase [unclassified Rubrivirga]MDT0632991.1 alpha-glucan family phosphorylase [Rubrivirga sp. F394]MDT7857881.1 alpha-glucan family phosphorylase [Rubrivirga sp. S365]